MSFCSGDDEKDYIFAKMANLHFTRLSCENMSAAVRKRNRFGRIRLNIE